MLTTLCRAPSHALLLSLCGVDFPCSACLVWEPRDTRGVRIANGTDETATVFVSITTSW